MLIMGNIKIHGKSDKSLKFRIKFLNLIPAAERLLSFHAQTRYELSEKFLNSSKTICDSCPFKNARLVMATPSFLITFKSCLGTFSTEINFGEGLYLLNIRSKCGMTLGEICEEITTNVSLQISAGVTYSPLANGCCGETARYIEILLIQQNFTGWGKHYMSAIAYEKLESEFVFKTPGPFGYSRLRYI